MALTRQFVKYAATVCWLCASSLPAQAPAPSAAPQDWFVTVGKSIPVDSPLPIYRVDVTDPTVVEAVGISPKELLINGKAPGETSVFLWQTGGSRLQYDVIVRPNPAKMDAVRQQIELEFPGSEVSLAPEGDSIFVRGTVKDLNTAERVAAMAATLGKVVNLLHVEVPKEEPQILVKVRFCDVDRSASRNLSIDFASGALGQTSAVGPDQPFSLDGNKTASLSSAVNIFLFRPDINLSAAIQALASKNLIQMLAEPTVPAYNGKPASFVAGGEFPFPMVQPGSNGTAGAVTIQWREYGVRLNFLPTITPRGTIHLEVAPEVSSLDYSHVISVAGTSIPALSSRKVRTEIELSSGQSFVIAGLLDNQTTDNLSKVPGIGDLPILGKLFQSKVISRTNSELLVIVTPELVRPIPQGNPVPDLQYPQTFLPDNTKTPLRQPGMDSTGPVPVTPPQPTVPVETLLDEAQTQQQAGPAAAPAAASPAAAGGPQQ